MVNWVIGAGLYSSFPACVASRTPSPRPVRLSEVPSSVAGPESTVRLTARVQGELGDKGKAWFVEKTWGKARETDCDFGDGLESGNKKRGTYWLGGCVYGSV